MKTFLADIIPKLKGFSEKLDNLTLLTNQHWVVIDELHNSKFVYIFRSNSELLISKNGKVEKGKWEYLGNNSLLIERKDESFLFRHGFFDSSILALKVDGLEEYSFLVNENNYGGDLNNIDKVLNFLETKYLQMLPQNQFIMEGVEKIENVYLKKEDTNKYNIKKIEISLWHKLTNYDKNIGKYITYEIISEHEMLKEIVINRKFDEVSYFVKENLELGYFDNAEELIFKLKNINVKLKKY
jgi:hypothetical protein